MKNNKILRMKNNNKIQKFKNFLKIWWEYENNWNLWKST